MTTQTIAPKCRCICKCVEPSTKVADIWSNTRYVGFCRRCAANKCDGVPRGEMPDYSPDRRFTREPIGEWPPAEACAEMGPPIPEALATRIAIRDELKRQTSAILAKFDAYMGDEAPKHCWGCDNQCKGINAAFNRPCPCQCH